MTDLFPTQTAKPLWEHQRRAIQEVRDTVKRGVKRVLLQSPVGSGKTRLAAEIGNMALRKGNGFIFTVPAISLIDQTVEAFRAEGITDIGVIQSDHPLTNFEAKVQIASVQTLMGRQIPKTRLVMIDEAHRMFEFITKWMSDEAWADTTFIGLSATPWARGLGRLYDELIIGSTTKELIEKGILCPFRVFAPAHPDLSGVKTVAGDYHQEQLSEAMQRGALVADTVTKWLELGEQRPTFCFAVDRNHAATLQDQFRRAGVSCAYMDANTPLKDREGIRRRFESGEIKVVCNVGVLTTGIDWDVRCIILARPTKSEMLYVQMMGRGLRSHEGKADLIIIDHSDTTLRLGFVTDIHRPKLDDGKMTPQERKEEKEDREAEKPLPKECPSCHALRSPRIRECPQCGFAPHGRSDVETVEGDLVQLTARKVAKLNQDSPKPQKAAFFAELQGHAVERGFKPGWAAMKYKERFGVWPNDREIRNVPPKPPSNATRQWIKSRQIAWAFSKNREARDQAGEEQFG